MSAAILVTGTTVLVVFGLAAYGIVVSRHRDRAALSTLERWSDGHGLTEPDGAAVGPDDLPRRMDRVVLSRAGNGLTVVSYVYDDGEADTELLLMQLELPADGVDTPFSSAFRRGRRRWARELSERLELDSAGADALGAAAAAVDGAVHTGNGRLTVVHYGQPDAPTLDRLLDATRRLAAALP